MDNIKQRPHYWVYLFLITVFGVMVYLFIRYPLITIIAIIAIIAIVKGPVVLKDRRAVSAFYRNSSVSTNQQDSLYNTLDRVRSGIVTSWKLKGYTLKAVSKAVLVFKNNNRYCAEFLLLTRYRRCDGSWCYATYTFRCSQLLSGKLYAIVTGQANEKDLPPIDLVATNANDVFMLRSENPNRA